MIRAGSDRSPVRRIEGAVQAARSLPTVIAVLTAAVAIQACRDAPAPYDPGGGDPPEPVRQITFDTRDDRVPTWTPDGERIVYVRGDLLSIFSDLPVVLDLSANGGRAEVLYPDLQGVDGLGSRAFTVPAVDPRSGRIAFQQRLQLAPDVLCGGDYWLCESSGHPVPPTVEGIPDSLTDAPPLHTILDLFALRVRAPTDEGNIETGPSLEIRIPGRTEDPDVVNPPLFQPVVGRTIVDYYPAHRLFARDGTQFFRPSWSPVADRIAYSDGLGLWTWMVGTASATPIPGTVDGISPAWSPDGQWIAFVRLERTAEVNDICGIFTLSNSGSYEARCVQETTDYGLGRTFVEIVRPDGTGGEVIGEGLDPAWTPDGQFLYVRRDGELRRLGIENDSDLPVPDTEGGREPAVSPDGTQLVFSRGLGSQYDIWIVPALP
jgi:hypothetical protein